MSTQKSDDTVKEIVTNIVETALNEQEVRKGIHDELPGVKLPALCYETPKDDEDIELARAAGHLISAGGALVSIAAFNNGNIILL